MTLYEINNALANFEPEIDMETGELLNADALDALQMARDEKRESIALLIKNLDARATAREAEAKNLKELAEADKKRKESLMRYLAADLNGERFETARCKISYRKSTSVAVGDEFMEWAAIHNPSLIRTTIKSEPDKTAIKEALKNGEKVEGASLVESKTMSVK